MGFLLSEIANKAFLVRPDQTVLMLKDSGTMPGHEWAKGYWDVPGGRMDADERSCRTALARELQEEMSYSLKDDQEMVLIDTFLHARPNGTFNHLHYYVVVTAQDTTVTLSREHSEYRWMSRTELEQLEDTSHKPAIAALLKWFVQQG